ncbi:TraR/DksA C4-type zinc finger protein [Candidatus Thioglobus autotrophicus]|jgi:hypothetical protein|uniref:TraR/DksA C4-type zinc finger protein n=1 Tax=Candidatus Thioglobus autotrophicus TaxID=1705394 RepID=UPI00299E063A|nr:TraR/DksA C4-type zinc finger protein [Candidatus Thioglobus autotrophicus]WPE18695.1 TraR/DksA C4-type zinc finger protein [Candidatus Thioglobus autotrophicus]
MNREDEICLTLQGLVNGIDYETGEIIEFSDTVKNSLKVIAATFKCQERCQQISGVSEMGQSNTNDWDVVKGTFKEIIKSIKSDRPNHLVIIQNGYFYDILGDDAAFFVDRFSYNTYVLNGVIRAGFPIHSKKVFLDLREMRQSFVLVSQLPKGDSQKVRRAISEIYDGDDKPPGSEIADNGKPSSNYDCGLTLEDDLPDSIINPCIKCGCEIPQTRLDSVDDAIRCAKCQSDFEKNNPDSISRKIEDKGIMTREGAKQMRAKQYGTNVRNKI